MHQHPIFIQVICGSRSVRTCTVVAQTCHGEAEHSAKNGGAFSEDPAVDRLEVAVVHAMHFAG